MGLIFSMKVSSTSVPVSVSPQPICRLWPTTNSGAPGIVPQSYPFFLTRNWAAPYRADRIAQLLDRTPKQTPASTAAIQADTVSLAARELLPLMLQTHPRDHDSAQALKLLRKWNGDMRRDRAAPLIFTAWLREFERELFKPRLGAQFDRYWKPRAVMIDRVLQGKAESWCRPDAAATDPGCAGLLAKSLRKSVAQLEKKLGGDVGAWRWGREHRAYFWSFVSQAPAIGSWFSTTMPVGGGNYTIDAGYMKFADRKHPYRADTGPGLRMILDFSDLAGSRFLIAPGMSGNPLSSHYSDLLGRWRKFHYLILGREAAAHRLRLTPRGGRSG